MSFNSNELQTYDLLIQFFKINDPLRIAYVFLIGLVIRLIAYIWVVPLLVPEFQWMLLGEKLSEGFLLYGEIEDHTAVLSGAVFWIMDSLFGRSHLAHQFVSFLLIMVQAISLNLIINKFDILKERNYFPALVYIFISSLFVDFYVVSPVLLGTTFVILGFGKLFQILKNGNNDELSFHLGLSLGLAVLFYKPLSLFLVLALLNLLLYSNTIFRRYIISLFSFIFPLLLIITYFYWRHSLSGFIEFFFLKSFSVTTHWYQDLTGILFILVPVLILGVFGFFALLKANGYINYQTKCHYVFLHWLVVGSISVLFASEVSLFSFLIILPPITLFVSAFFLEMRIKWLAEIYFLVFIIIALMFGYSLDNAPWSTYNFTSLKKIVLYEKSIPSEGRLLVLSDDISYYKGNKVATRILNWRVSSKYFSQLNDYNNISYLYSLIKEDFPDVIIDPDGYCNQLFYHLPEVSKNYSKSGNMYIKVTNDL